MQKIAYIRIATLSLVFGAAASYLSGFAGPYVCAKVAPQLFAEYPIDTNAARKGYVSHGFISDTSIITRGGVNALPEEISDEVALESFSPNWVDKSSPQIDEVLFSRNDGGTERAVPVVVGRTLSHRTSMVYRAGWPIRCLFGRKETLIPDISSTPHKVQVLVSGMRRSEDVRFSSVWFPRLIEPVGFICNSLIYFVAFTVFLGLPVSIRAITRQRRGLCGACGYAVGGPHIENIRCPECGAVIDGLPGRRGGTDA